MSGIVLNHIRRNTKALLVYLVLISALYSPVVFGGKSLQPALYQPHGLMEGWPYGYQGRTPVNTFNVDLATPAYYEWPVNKLVGDMYKSGSLPLWNPYQAAGTPLAAEYSTRAFFPYQVLEDTSPVRMWDYFLLGRLLIAGFFSFLFLSRIGLSFSASLLGGIFYMFSGTMVWFINLEQMTNVAMMLPVLLYSLELMVRKPGGMQMAILGVICALVLLGGQPEVAFYVMFLAVCYFVFRALQLYRGKALVSISINFMFALALGIALAAPQTLPFLEFVSSSHHAHHPRMGIGTETILNWKRAFVSLTPTATEIPADPEILPEVLTKLEEGAKQPTYFRVFATKGVWDWMGGYTGILSVFLALVGVFWVLVKKAGQERGLLLFFFCFGAVILLKHFGVKPFLWLGYLPIFDVAWGLRWAGPTWVFSFSVAGAIGFHTFLRCKTPATQDTRPGSGSKDAVSSEVLEPTCDARMRKYLTYIAMAVFITFLGIYVCVLLPEVAVLSVERNLHFSPLSAPYIIPSMLIGHLETILILAAAFVMTLHYVKSGRGVYGFIGLAVLEFWWAIPRGYNYYWLYLKLVPFGVGLVLVFTLWKERWRWVAGTAVLFVISSFCLDATAPYGFPDRYNPFTEPPYVAFLRGKKDAFRVMGGYGVLYPNYAGSVGLQDIRYISALMIPAYKQYRWEHLQEALDNEELLSSSLWFTGRPERVIIVYDQTIGRYFKVVRHGVEEDIMTGLPYYSLLGVKYILMPSDFVLRDTGPHGDKTDVPYLPLIYDNEIKIYENPGALPRSFITNDFEVVSSGDVKIPIPRRQAPSRPRDGTVTSADFGFNVKPARIEEYRPNKVSIAARLEHPGLLVLSDVYYAGWEAYIDGRRTRIFRVNALVRGVFLREGDHRVEFRYKPKSFTVGAALGAIGLIAIVSLLLPSRRYPQSGP